MNLEEVIIALVIIAVIIIVGTLFKSVDQKRALQSPSTASSRAPKTAEAVPLAPSNPNFTKIVDQYQSLEEVQGALRAAGLESSNLILAIDYTKSNDHTGRQSFHGKSLHHIQAGSLNPYQEVISIIGKTLEPFDDDKLIPTFGFGDSTTKASKVFPFYPDGRPCKTCEEVLSRYTEITPYILLSGPTNFAPAIYKAINIVKAERDFHVLVIVADGQVVSEKETVDAIVEASKYALSIVLVGVGDGPWETMQQFDDELPQRQFDNFQFVNFTEISGLNFEESKKERAFAIAALMELPEQYKAIRRLKLL